MDINSLTWNISDWFVLPALSLSSWKMFTCLLSHRHQWFSPKNGFQGTKMMSSVLLAGHTDTVIIPPSFNLVPLLIMWRCADLTNPPPHPPQKKKWTQKWISSDYCPRLAGAHEAAGPITGLWHLRLASTVLIKVSASPRPRHPHSLGSTWRL